MIDLTAALTWMPDWLRTVLIFLAAIGVGWTVHSFLFRLLRRLVAGQDLFWRSLVSRSSGPSRLVILIVCFAFAARVSPLTDEGTDIVSRIFAVAIIGLIAWLAHSALHIFTTVYLRRFKLDAEDNLLARKHTTQIRILQRVANVVIIVTAVAAMLMTFESVRTYGVSLLASAGAAGLIAGLALQPVLKNLFAGIQIAITQPMRIDDVVIVEGEWGTIEEITSTYVVVKVWDQRRLVIPLSYFIEQPFQNWTRESSDLIGVVYIYLDHTAPLDEIRQKAHEIVEASPLWNKDVFNQQVTDFTATNMQVRIIASAPNAGDAWALRCEIREKLITWLQEAHPSALPRTRTEIDKLPDPGPDSGLESMTGHRSEEPG